MDCHGVYKLTCVHTRHIHPSTAYTSASCSSHARPRKPSKHSHSPSPLSRPRSEHSASSERLPRSVLPLACTSAMVYTAPLSVIPADVGYEPEPRVVMSTSNRNCTPVWPGLSANVMSKSIESSGVRLLPADTSQKFVVPWPLADGMCCLPSVKRWHVLMPAVRAATVTPSITSFGSARSASCTFLATTVSVDVAAMPSVRQMPPYGSWYTRKNSWLAKVGVPDAGPIWMACTIMPLLTVVSGSSPLGATREAQSGPLYPRSHEQPWIFCASQS